MFDKLRQNISSGVEAVRDNFSDAIQFSKDIFRNEEPEYTSRVDNAIEQQSRRDMEESSNSIVDWFNNYQQKEADAGRFSLLNMGKIGDYRKEQKAQREYEEQLFNEGIFDKSDMSLFGKGLKTVGERTAGNVYDMLIAPIFRSGVALTNYLSGKVGQGLNFINDKTGIGFQVDEDTNSWMRDSNKFLEETNPVMADRYKTFFGLKEDQNDVNLQTVGEEYAQLLDMVGVKVDPKYIPAVGFIGSAIDVFPGAGGGKNALKTAVKNAKSVDEVLMVLKGVAKGSDDDLLRFANQLFKAKDESAVGLWKMIEDEDIGESTIKFLKDKGGNIEKNIEKVSREQTNKLLDDANKVAKQDGGVVDAVDELQNLGFETSRIDNVGSVVNKIDDAETELRGLIDEIKKIDLPEDASKRARDIKELFNQSAFDDLTLTQRLKALDLVEEVAPTIAKTKDEMADLINYYNKIDQGIVEELRSLDKEALEEFGKQFTEGLTDAQNRVASGIANNNTEEAIAGIVDATRYKNTAGKVLNVVGEIKAKVKTTKAQDRLADAVNAFKKQGKETDEIVSIFKNGAKEKGKTLSDLDVKDIEDIFGKNSPTNWGSLIEMYRYSNMLSNTATHAINMISNTAENTVARPIVESIASVFEMLGVRGTGRELGDVGRYYKSLFNGDNLSQATRKAIQVFNEADELKHIDIDRIPTEWKVGGRDIAKDFRIPLRALEGGDAFMYEAVRLAEIEKILGRPKYKGRTLTTSEMNTVKKEAGMIAEDAIFRVTKDNPMHGAISKLTGWMADQIKYADKSANDLLKKAGVDIHPVKWMVPFVNTISRLSAKQLRRIPVLGMFEAIGNKDVAGVLADQAFGIGMTYAGYSLYKHKPESWKLDRGDKNATSTKYADVEGNAYNSVNIGENQWVELEALGPGAGPIFFGAKIAQAEADGRFDFGDKDLLESAGQFIGAITTLMGGELSSSLDQKFMQSALDIPSVLRGDKNKWTQVSQTLRQFIPYSSLMGAINRAFVDNEKKITPETF
ncbi:hypothetical protein KDA08_04455, partial [Candidatus Saccharibacteria bacterium]|nr:hypothetical protein [Candidatus Saccharibacteria bacterium]